MKTADAINRAMSDHVDMGAKINELREAAFMLAQECEQRGVRPDPVEYRKRVYAAVAHLPPQDVDWDHHNALRDAVAGAAAIEHYPELLAAAEALVDHAHDAYNSDQQTDTKSIPLAITRMESNFCKFVF